MALLDSVREQIRGIGDGYNELVSYPHAVWRLVVDGHDISAAVEQRLESLELTDNRGMQADQLSITLSDHDGLLAIPPKGAKVHLWLGWSDTGLIDKGTYTVDETEHSGAPDVLSIRARSVDLREGFKARRERSFNALTLGNIIRAIATGQGLTAVIGQALDALQIPHLDQANESDANLLTRLGTEYDAIATVKAGRLLFMPAGGAATASGATMPHINLTRADGDGHRFLQADRDSYDGVRAYYYEVNSAEKKEAIAGRSAAPGEQDNLKDLRHVYTDQASALVAARAEWRRLQRGTATLSYELAKGRPELVPEMTYSLHGVKPEIDAIVWLGGNVRHRLDGNGLTTSLELDSQLPDAEDVAELATGGSYTGVVAWYRDEKTGKQASVTEGDQTSPRRLTHLYASKANAERAAKRELKRMQEAPDGR